ncbi:MAG: hypothetical protein ABFR32_01845 [Bacteroidota bacterium]
MTVFHKIISFVFHPIFFSTVGSLLYFLISPQYIPDNYKKIIISVIFISTYILPLFLLIVLKKLKLIHSFQLKTIEERKFPIIFLIVLTFMLGKMLLSTNIVSLLGLSFYGSSVALTIVFILFSINFKTSLHTLGIGSIIGFTMVMSIDYQINLTLLIAFLIIIFGFLATSRLALKAHQAKEVYLGVFLGIITQLMIYQFL